jgi:hypothetical protein
LQALETLRFPLSGLQKRHIQPERYVPCFRFSGYISCTKIDFKKEKKLFKNYSLAGQLDAFTPQGIVMKACKKYIFQYITGKVAHMDAIVSQNIRRLFLFDR